MPPTSVLLLGWEKQVLGRRTVRQPVAESVEKKVKGGFFFYDESQTERSLG